MISIIICARNKDIDDVLRENIAQTIGTEYEIIVINNSLNKYSLFSAYNKGVSLSKYPLLIFMHDDIAYHTKNWGKNVLLHFENISVGAIGIAGSPYMSINKGGWWSSGLGYLYLLQSENKNKIPERQNYFPSLNNNRQVVMLDGVWFCVRKQIFDIIQFDEENFKGFHFYDLDTTLQVYQSGFKLLCIEDITIHHFSKGNLNKKWLEGLNIFYNKWNKVLPISCIKLTKYQMAHAEYRVINTYIGDSLNIIGNTQKNKRTMYLDAIKKLVQHRELLFFYKTPYWILKFFCKYFN